MTIFAKSRVGKMALRLALVAGAGLSLSACTTDFGLGYASDGYNNYDCDPYSQFDNYYSCDYGYGFSNIGYGGGWYDNYYYPGYGIFLFDNYGQRYNMRDNYRRYWAGRRNEWQREHYRGERREGNYQGGGYQGSNHNDWQGQHHEGRGDRRDDNRHEGRHEDHHDGRGNGNWQGGNGTNGAVIGPRTPNPEPGRDYGRRGNWGNEGRDGIAAPRPDIQQGNGQYRQPRFERRDWEQNSGQEGAGREGRRGNYSPPQPGQQPAPQAAPQNTSPLQASKPVPERRTARPEAREQRRQRDEERRPEQ